MRFKNSKTDQMIESLPWQDNLRPGNYYLTENTSPYYRPSEKDLEKQK